MALSAQNPGSSISADAGLIFPVGASSSNFKMGYRAGLSYEYVLRRPSFLYFIAQSEFEYLPIVSSGAVAGFTVAGGAGLTFNPAEKLHLGLRATGGYYYGSITGGGLDGSGFALTTGLSAAYSLSPMISLGLDADYRYRHDYYNGIGLSINARFNLSSLGGRKNSTAYLDTLRTYSVGMPNNGLRVTSVDIEPVFPVLFRYYDENPIGTVTLTNTEDRGVRDVTLSLYVDRYMDNPKQIPVIDEIPAGESMTVDLYALFSDSVLEITEGTKASGYVILSYRLQGSEQAAKYIVSIDFLDRNALTWDDDRKAASFVTAKDPAILEFSKKITGWVKQDSPGTIDENLRIAMGIHESLRMLGLSYQIDPTTPFSDFHQEAVSVDFLQFPYQTLSYTSGDCDDLSILYCALLEAVGIETAFITIPGHIYMAFALDMSAGDAERIFRNSDNLIFHSDKVWIPVEITMTQDSFLSAWNEGSREWRSYNSQNKAALYPMSESWKVYPPVGLPGSTDPVLPIREDFREAYVSELSRFIEQEIYPQVSVLEERIRESDNPSLYRNRLGILYARYGLTDQAELIFDRILTEQEYVPALINSGNLRFLSGDFRLASNLYQRAYSQEADNPKTVLAMARVNYEMENYGSVSEYYSELKLLNPVLAERYRFLEFRGDEAERAEGTSEVREEMVWADEE